MKIMKITNSLNDQSLFATIQGSLREEFPHWTLGTDEDGLLYAEIEYAESDILTGKDAKKASDALSEFIAGYGLKISKSVLIGGFEAVYFSRA